MESSSQTGNGNLSTALRSYISVVAGGDERDGSPATLGDAAQLTDEELLRLIDGRSKVALEALYDRYSGAIYSLAIRMLRDAAAAE